MPATVLSAPVAAHELIYEPQQLPKLRSNHGGYLDESSVARMRQTSIDASTEEMRRRFEEDGYIWVKNVLPREDVNDMREAYFRHLEPTGILKPGTSPRDGIFNEDADPVVHNGVGGANLPESMDRVTKLVEAHTMPFYLAFLEHPHLRSFVRSFMQWGAGQTDIAAAQRGGLMYLEHSDDIGRNMEADFTKRAESFTAEERISGFNMNMAKDGQLSHNAEELTKDVLDGRWGGGQAKRRWLIGDYEAGDVVFHNPYLIHGAAKNEDPQGRIRLSTDLRFYEEGAPLDERWMRSVWHPDDGL
ncbi:hypothetical protein MBLNU230_g2097t1 [Neophaeotheca triangularis]